MSRQRVPAPPRELTAFQRWFGFAAARPLLPGNRTREKGIRGKSLRREAATRLRSARGMDGFERLAVYNRQYWFRLIGCMQEEFPCTLHVLGLDVFNGWCIRYLAAHPSRSPYLSNLDHGFPAFLAKRYRGRDRAKVLEAAAHDRAFSRAFDGADGAPPGADWNPGDVKIGLAPHVTPLWLHWDFSAYRPLCRADEPLTGRFPLRRIARGVCVYRRGPTVYEMAISRSQYRLLEALARPRTPARLFRAVEREAPPRELREMERRLASWFRDWTALGLITAVE